LEHEFLLSVDPSLRSTGWCLFNQKTKELKDFGVIKTDHLDNVYEEDRLYHIADYISSKGSHDTDLVIEGLSFMAKSAKRDLIDGMHWIIRTIYYVCYQETWIGVIPVTEWRNSITTKEDRDYAKKNYDKKIYLKEVVVDMLPSDILVKFDTYIKENGYDYETLYDLTDAYFIGQYRLTL